MIDPSRPSAGYPLTPLQHGMLFQTLVAPGAGVNVEQVVCTLREAVDVERMRAAWQHLVRRHEVLRTVFSWTGVPEPMQEVRDAAEVSLDVRDHAGVPPADRAARLEAFLGEDRARGFDLSATPPLRVTLFRHGADEHVLVWSFHHVLLDGRSVTLLLGELFACYEGGAEAEAALAPPRPFREHVARLEARPAEADAAYWSRTLRGFDGPAPLPAPRHAPRDPAVEPAWGERELRLSDEETAALRAFEAREGVWLSALMAGAWALLLGRCTNAAEAVFGVVRGGRAAEGSEDTVGLLANTVPFRVPLPPGARVIDWLDEIGEQAAALAAHEHASPADIARWSGLAAGTPLFHALLDYQPRAFDAPLRALGGAWASRELRIHRRPGAPLAAAVTGDAPLRIRIAYDADRFGAAAVDELLGAFAHLLRALAANPRARLGDVEWRDAEARRRAAEAWNDTAAPLPLHRCTHELVAEQAARAPDAPALWWKGAAVSYAELDARAGRIAAQLRRLGVRPETRVALFLEPGVHTVASVLGVMKAGGAFVPLDPAAPPARLAALLRDCAPALVVTESRLAPALPFAEGAVLRVDDASVVDPADEPLASAADVEPESLAYVIYTSGSTGAPKGVAVPHRAIANHLLGMAHAFGFGAGDVGVEQASCTFDKWLIEVFGPLVSGGSVRLLPPADQRDPARALPSLRGATLLYAVPAVLRRLVEEDEAHGGGAFSTVRHVFTGGDRVPPDLLARVRRALAPGAEVRVVYGPTETTVVCTAWALPPEGAAEGHPIGFPLPNVRAYVRGAPGPLVPDGTTGELWIGGEALARGYLGRPARTAAAFAPDPFGPPGARLYRTGDRVRRRPDGALEYLGRLDEQVKVRGYRIEPGEVEAALRALPGVAECVVVVREDAPGEARLVAYLTGAADPATLRAPLRERLPAWMIPAAFVPLHRLPLNANGKVDRAALPPPDLASLEAYVAPRTAVEARLAEIWAGALGCERIGIRDHFQEVGGHSLVATRVVARIRDVLDGEITVATLAERPTIEALAAVLSERDAPRGAAVDPKSSPDHLLAVMDDLSDDEIDRLLAAHTDPGLPS